MRSTIRFTILATIAFGCTHHFQSQAADNEMMVVKVLDLKGLKTNFRERGSIDKPTQIKSADELPKVFDDEKIQASIKSAVNFKTQHVLLFRWAGSGQDKLTHKVDSTGDEPQVIFQYRRGRSRDLRGHARAFVIQNGVKWKIET